jgi:SAM-dependent methyltransferase
VDPTRRPTCLKKHFLRAARALRRDNKREIETFTTAAARIYRRDARHLHIASNSIEAVITSPPYWSMYDYFDVHRLTYLAMDWNRYPNSQVGRQNNISRDGADFVAPYSMTGWYHETFRAEETARGRSLRAYFQDIRKQLQELKRVLRPGGIAAFAVADGFRLGREFRLSTALSNCIREGGFREVHKCARENSTRRILPAGRDAVTGRFSSGSGMAVQEFIIYARR